MIFEECYVESICSLCTSRKTLNQKEEEIEERKRKMEEIEEKRIEERQGREEILFRLLCYFLEDVCAKNLEATILFVDFTKAFDSIHRVKMEQILLAYGLPIETVAAIMMLYRNAKVFSLDGDTDHFDIVAGVLLGDTLALYLLIMPRLHAQNVY